MNVERQQKYARVARTVLATAFSTLVPLMLGWGLTDIAGFFADPVRSAFAVTVLAGSLACIVFRLDINPYRRGPITAVSGGRIQYAYLLGMVTMWLLVASMDHRGSLVFGDRRWIRLLGLMSYAAGDVLRILALRELGKQYSSFLTLQRDHKLIQTGVYAMIRHPFYLGQSLAVPGTALVFRSYLAPVIVIATIPFVVMRIKREEKFLIDRLGPEYARYQGRTWKLLPHLY